MYNNNCGKKDHELEESKEVIKGGFGERKGNGEWEINYNLKNLKNRVFWIFIMVKTWNIEGNSLLN